MNPDVRRDAKTHVSSVGKLIQIEHIANVLAPEAIRADDTVRQLNVGAPFVVDVSGTAANETCESCDHVVMIST